MKVQASGMPSFVQEIMPVRKPEEMAKQAGQEADQNDAITSYVRIDRKNLGKAVEKMNKAAELFDQRITFRVHDQTQRLVVQIVDDSTGEVIKQIPPKELLDLEAKISEMIGVILDKHV